jgi:hypothetical protein
MTQTTRHTHRAVSASPPKPHTGAAMLAEAARRALPPATGDPRTPTTHRHPGASARPPHCWAAGRAAAAGEVGPGIPARRYQPWSG